MRILRHEAIVAYLVSRQRMEAIVETLELLSNPAAVKAIGAHKEGKTKFASLSVLGKNEK